MRLLRSLMCVTDWSCDCRLLGLATSCSSGHRVCAGLSVGVQILLFSISCPITIECFHFSVRNHSELFQREQGRTRRKIGKVCGMFFPTRMTVHHWRADSFCLPDFGTNDCHSRAELDARISLNIRRPELLELRQHFRKPGALCVS